MTFPLKVKSTLGARFSDKSVLATQMKESLPK